MGTIPLEATSSNLRRDVTPVRVLLVEDNQWDADLFKSCVGDLADVTVVQSGGEAFGRIFRQGVFASAPLPQLIILDLSIPVMSGHELLNAIKAHSTTLHIPVIVWSGSKNPKDIRRAYELGACSYMVKETSLAEMEAAIHAFAEFWLRVARYQE